MRGPHFAQLSAFVAVAEQRSFTRAALQLGLSPASLSQTVRAAEERLGLRLLNRTTRSVAPTSVGELLLGRLRPALEDIESALESINIYRDQPVGHLRLTVESAASDCVIGAILGRFAAEFPGIQLDISVDDAEIDIVAGGFDAGIRLASEVDRDMVAVRVSEPVRYVVVGSPAYFARRPAPEIPEELSAHGCIRHKLPSGSLAPWCFERQGERRQIPVNAAIVVNDIELALRAALDGAGLVYTTESIAEKPLAENRLVAVLQQWMPRPRDGFALYYTSRRQNAAALRCLIEFLKNDLRKREAPQPATGSSSLCNEDREWSSHAI
jgi:DNA-binding transcriptional LysR family regulator